MKASIHTLFFDKASNIFIRFNLEEKEKSFENYLQYLKDNGKIHDIAKWDNPQLRKLYKELNQKK